MKKLLFGVLVCGLIGIFAAATVAQMPKPPDKVTIKVKGVGTLENWNHKEHASDPAKGGCPACHKMGKEMKLKDELKKSEGYTGCYDNKNAKCHGEKGHSSAEALKAKAKSFLKK